MVLYRNAHNFENLLKSTDTLESFHEKIKKFLQYPDNVVLIFFNGEPKDLPRSTTAKRIKWREFENHSDLTSLIAEYSQFEKMMVADHTSG